MTSIQSLHMCVRSYQQSTSPILGRSLSGIAPRQQHAEVAQ